jgi:hypothetical protein
VPFGRQALDVKGAPTVALNEIDDFTGQGATGNQKHFALSGGELKLVRWLKINSGHQFLTYQIGGHAEACLDVKQAVLHDLLMGHFDKPYNKSSPVKKVASKLSGLK